MEQSKIRVEEPNLISFVDTLVKYASEGYVVEDSNEGAPQSWGPGLYTATMIKLEDKTEEDSQEDGQKPQEKPKTTKTTRRRKTSK